MYLYNQNIVVEVEVLEINSNVSIFFGRKGAGDVEFDLDNEFERKDGQKLQLQQQQQQQQQCYVLASDVERDETYYCEYLDKSYTFLTDGCIGKWLDDSISYCFCNYFSNFGLFFFFESNDSWTTLRILFFVLLFFVWFLMFIFFLMVCFFSMSFKLESYEAK